MHVRRSRKIQEGVLSQVHTAVADVAQDAIEQIIKDACAGLVSLCGLLIRGHARMVRSIRQPSAAIVRDLQTRAYHGVHAIFDVRVYGNNTVEFDEGGAMSSAMNTPTNIGVTSTCGLKTMVRF